MKMGRSCSSRACAVAAAAAGCVADLPRTADWTQLSVRCACTLLYCMSSCLWKCQGRSQACRRCRRGSRRLPRGRWTAGRRRRPAAGCGTGRGGTGCGGRRCRRGSRCPPRGHGTAGRRRLPRTLHTGAWQCCGITTAAPKSSLVSYDSSLTAHPSNCHASYSHLEAGRG